MHIITVVFKYNLRCTYTVHIYNEFGWHNISGHSAQQPLAVSTACHWPCLIMGHRPMTKELRLY